MNLKEKDGRTYRGKNKWGLVKKIAGALTGLSLVGFFVNVWPELGKRPGPEDRARFVASPNFDTKKNVFVNRIPDLLEQMNKRVYKWKNISEWFKKGVDRSPSVKLPEIKPDMASFLKPSNDIKVIWFGHSSFLLNLDGIIVLVDPVFSTTPSPLGFGITRFQAPPLELTDLPAVDYVLISHDHYDHLNRESVMYFADKNTLFITPLGVASHLKSWGISGERITEKDWWQTAEFKGIKFTATPAQHFSGRIGVKPNTTLWASWVVKTKTHNIYFSGDTGYDIHFKQIGEKYGPFDVAFMETGQYNHAWREVHMMPEEAVLAYKDLKAKKYFPVHWGMFVLSLHTWYDPVERLFNLSKEHKVDLIAAKLGQIISVNLEQYKDEWWKTYKAASLNNKPQQAMLKDYAY